MQSVILVAHLMIAIALIIVILLQRSEGGALGIGGGGGGGGGLGGMMRARGAAGGLVRISVFLGVAFFLTSIGLSIFGNIGGSSVLDALPEQTAPLPAGAGTAADSGDSAAPETGNAAGAGDAEVLPPPVTPAPAASDEPIVPLSQ